MCVCVYVWFLSLCVVVRSALQAAPAMARIPAQVSAAAVSGDRNMANVKALRMRLASVKSIQRITKTMKMVAAAKLKGFQTRMMAVSMLLLFVFSCEASSVFL